jgi:hypothetical protein
MKMNEMLDQEIVAQLTLEGQSNFKTAINGWQRDYGFAEIRGYAHIDAILNKDGTYTVRYWDRNWRENPGEFIVIAKKVLTKEELVNDIKERNDFIDQTIQRYERQKRLNNVLSEHLSR